MKYIIFKLMKWNIIVAKIDASLIWVRGNTRRISFLQPVDLRRIKHPSTTPHSTYHCDICILHIVKVIPILISERAQIRRYTLAWKMYYAPPCKGPISVEENQATPDLEDV